MNGSGNGASTVAAVILNYRRPEETVECVRSLLASAGTAPRIIVVDNGSDDGSADLIAEAVPGVHLIRCRDNIGYAGGNNVGIRAGLEGPAGHVFVINNDCIVAPDALERMVATASESGADIVSPKVYDYFSPGEIQYAGYRNLHLLAQGVPVGEGQVDRGQFDRERLLDAAPGCALLLSRRLCEQVGLFDEQYFAYSEELDLCRRAREKGLKILFVPAARVWHKKGATLSQGSPDYVYYLTRGRLIYARKHLGWAAYIFVFLPYFMAVKVIKPCIGYLLRRRWGNISAILRAVSWNLTNRVYRDGVNVKL